MKLFKKTRKAFTLVEIMIVVAIIGILIAIAVPGFVQARTTSRARSCQENLTKIDGAKEQWALENNKSTADTPTWAELAPAGGAGYMKKEPKCPQGGVYTIGAVGTEPTCSVGGDHALTAIGEAPAA